MAIKAETIQHQPSSESAGAGKIRKTAEIFKKHSHFFSGGIFVVSVMILVILNFPANVKGNEAVFLPAVCTGDWSFMENVPGATELDANALFGEFNTTNSALPAPDSMELACGSFIGSMPENTAVDRVSLHLSWAFGSKSEALKAGQIVNEQDKQDELTNKPINESIPEVQPRVDFGASNQSINESTNQPTSPTREPGDQGAGADVDQGVNGSTGESVAEPTSQPAPEVPSIDIPSPDSTNQQINESTKQPDQPTSESSSVPTGFRISSFDESAPSDNPAPADQPLPEFQAVQPVDDASPEQSVAPSDNIVEQTPAEAPPENQPALESTNKPNNESTNQPNQQTSPVDESSVPVGPQSETGIATDTYFAIEYSVDNENWNSLAQIGLIDFSRDFNFSVPLVDDLASLQIRVRTLNPLPEDLAVFLDGMFLGINYKPSEDDFYLVEMKKQALDFSAVGLVDVKAIQDKEVAVKITTAEGKPEIWLFDITDATKTGYLLADAGKTDLASVLSVRGPFVFWLSADKLFAFDAVHKRFASKLRDFSEEQSDSGAKYSVKGLDFQMIVRNDMIYFYSDTAGELFSDDNSEVKEKFGKMYLDYLNENKDDVLDQQIMPNIVNEN